MYLRQHWRDERLAYDSAYGNVSVDGRLADRIWVPDTYLVNDKRSLVHDVTVKNRLLRFHHDGTIMYGIRYIVFLRSLYFEAVTLKDRQNI